MAPREERSSQVKLSKTAPWNPRLTNSYRDRYAQVGDRYFKVSADTLESLWTIEEIDADGEVIATYHGGRAPSEKIAAECSKAAV